LNLKKHYFNILQFFLFLALGIFLLHITFRKQDVSGLIEEVINADYFWALPVLFFSLLCYSVRVLRWKMLAKPLGYDPPFLHAFMALAVGYFINFAIPRAGELTRCAILRRTDRIPFNFLFGTVLTERLIDALSLLLIIILTIIFQFELLKDFVGSKLISPLYDIFLSRIIAEKVMVIIVLCLGIVIAITLFYFFRKYREHRIIAAISRFGSELWTGMKSIVHMKQRGLFLLYTLVIWICYLMMTYFWFFSFAATSGLTLSAAFTIMAIGSIGRSIPIQGGGVGAYHFLVANLVLLFGISDHYGYSLAIIIHAGQTIFTFLMGVLSMAGLFIIWRKTAKGNEQGSIS
jgi:uncharacterized protein (TIRG00374 family)